MCVCVCVCVFVTHIHTHSLTHTLLSTSRPLSTSLDLSRPLSLDLSLSLNMLRLDHALHRTNIKRVGELAAAGLWGIEAFSSEIDGENHAIIADLALQHGLVMTAGSDNHGSLKVRAPSVVWKL